MRLWQATKHVRKYDADDLTSELRTIYRRHAERETLELRPRASVLRQLLRVMRLNISAPNPASTSR